MADREAFLEAEETAGHEAPALPAESALATAYALERVQDDPSIRKHAAGFLRKQTQLVQLQRKLLLDERPLRLEQLRDQLRESGLRTLSQRLRIAFMLFGVAVAALVGLTVIATVYSAATSEQVVVEPFNTPPALASQGVNGRTVAGDLLDELSNIQAATRSAAKRRHLQNAWTNDVKIEVPETGVSIGELSRLLHEQLGHDIHIDELAQAAKMGPGWADPLKAWGDLLTAHGRWKSALAKYDAALKLAPGWSELRRARAIAAARALQSQ